MFFEFGLGAYAIFVVICKEEGGTILQIRKRSLKDNA